MEIVGGVDLSRYYEDIEVKEGEAGRPGMDPRLMISLWLYAYRKGVGSGRGNGTVVRADAAYQWLTGLEGVTYHTLSDFQ